MDQKQAKLVDHMLDWRDERIAELEARVAELEGWNNELTVAKAHGERLLRVFARVAGVRIGHAERKHSDAGKRWVIFSRTWTEDRMRAFLASLGWPLEGRECCPPGGRDCCGRIGIWPVRFETRLGCTVASQYWCRDI